MTVTLGSPVISPDDFGMCIQCGKFLKFDDDLQLHIANPDDIPKKLEAELIRVKMIWLQEQDKELK